MLMPEARRNHSDGVDLTPCLFFALEMSYGNINISTQKS